MKNNLVRFILAGVVLISLPAFLSAQGEYLTKGHSGLGVQAGLFHAGDIDGFAAEAGFSFLGFVDFGLGFARGSEEVRSDEAGGAEVTGADLTAIAFGPAVALHLYRPSNQNAFSVAVLMSYARTKVSLEWDGGSEPVGTSDGFSFEGVLYNTHGLSEKVDIVTSLRLSHSWENFDYENGDRVSEDFWTIHVSPSFAVRNLSGTVHISPGLSITLREGLGGGSQETLSLSLGYTFDFGELTKR
ncbi:MAG TPA: hypothetical protein VGA99_13185 [bacterium]